MLCVPLVLLNICEYTNAEGCGCNGASLVLAAGRITTIKFTLVALEAPPF